jgi:hypothetical protein
MIKESDIIHATEDIYVTVGYTSPQLAAKKGDKLTILHDGGTALIVKGVGQPFTVSSNKTDYKR